MGCTARTSTASALPWTARGGEASRPAAATTANAAAAAAATATVIVTTAAAIGASEAATVTASDSPVAFAVAAGHPTGPTSTGRGVRRGGGAGVGSGWGRVATGGMA